MDWQRQQGWTNKWTSKQSYPRAKAAKKRWMNYHVRIVLLVYAAKYVYKYTYARFYDQSAKKGPLLYLPHLWSIEIFWIAVVAVEKKLH